MKGFGLSQLALLNPNLATCNPSPVTRKQKSIITCQYRYYLPYQSYFPVVAEECMVNAHNMLNELSVVWHTISIKHMQTLRMSPVEVYRRCKII